MTRQYKSRGNQKGFAVVSLVLGAILLVGLFGAVVFGLKFARASGDSTDRSNASSLLAQAGNLKSAWNLYVARNQLLPTTYSNVTYKSNASSGFASFASAGMAPQLAPSAAMMGSNNKWVYRGAAIKFKGVGTSAGDYAIVLGDVSASVCNLYNLLANNVNYGDPPESGLDYSVFVGTSADTDLTAADLTSNADASYVPGWETGCMDTNDFKYVIFQVVRAQ